MIVFHGTIIEIQKPEIIKSETGRDFGFAFYTTGIKEQAERWAIRKAKIENRKPNKSVTPIVNVFQWEDNAIGLNIKNYDEISIEWLEMIVNCRSNISFVHPYDVIAGKIANDNVGETVSYVMQGIMRKEDAIERLRYEKINNQIAFCSNKALSTLKFIKSYIVRS